MKCKICGGDAPLHGVVDFNKSCMANRGVFFPLSGIPVWYHRCSTCGFLFTVEFDDWSFDDFKTRIYNDDYAKVDPEYLGNRAAENAPNVLAFAASIEAKVALDYGGGDGTLARLMCEGGLPAFSWDPLLDGECGFPGAAFNLVTAFEVMEHTPTPYETAKQALSFLPEGKGHMLFSTLCLDDLLPQCVDNAYIAPRNGHVSIHTKRSLDHLFGRLGRTLFHFNEGHHLVVPN